MKNLVLLFLFTLLQIPTFSQKPEPVYSFGRVTKPRAWYVDQSAAWKKEIDSNPKNALAWYYYYYANRNLYFSDTSENRHKNWKDFNSKLLEDMKQHLPESYEYHLISYHVDGFTGHWEKLDKIEKLGSDREEHLDGMINRGVIEREMERLNKYVLKKHEAGQFSTGMINYNYNMLAGLAPNAILLTAGDNDTYPSYLLQAQGIRTDVDVVNLSLLTIDNYREKLFKELGVGTWEKIWADPKTSGEAYKRYQEGIIKHIAANAKGRPLYVALTAAEDAFVKNVEEDLYLTGLAYLYSEEAVDNTALLKKNFEHLYALDYLQHVFYNDLSQEIVRNANRNYIVPMLKLYDHYRISGEAQKETAIRNKLLAVSKGTDDEEQVKKHLQQ